MINQQAGSVGGMMNSLKWAVVFGLIALALVGNYHFSDQSLLIRVVASFFLAIFAIYVGFQTSTGKKFWQFILEARNELRKVVWPTRKETFQTTGMVIAMVAILGLILWGVDTILLKVVAWLIGYGAS